MAVLLSKNLKKLSLAVAFTFLISGGLLYSPAFADYHLEDIPASGFSTVLPSGFSEQIPLKKKPLTIEQKEKIREAKAKLKQKRISFSNEEFIKQVKKNRIKNVELMLDAGMDPNTDYYGEYALFYAAKYNKTQTALLLLERGANPNAGFDSPLFWAIKHNNTDLANTLIEKGAKADFTELVSSKTLLYKALKKNNIEIARKLIENGAKIDSYSAAIIAKKDLYDMLEIERP